jgi:cytochrome c biogenesis protein CcmG/thiol:disulfide interchange protein DsbE
VHRRARQKVSEIDRRIADVSGRWPGCRFRSDHRGRGACRLYADASGQLSGSPALLVGASRWSAWPRRTREVPSPLIDKPAPQFTLAQLQEPTKTLGPDDMKGQVWLLNVWAWSCVACREEHPLLVELAKTWFSQLGDPYAMSVMDRDGRVGIDFGVYDVPETFAIDRNGMIRYIQIGPVTVASLEKEDRADHSCAAGILSRFAKKVR